MNDELTAEHKATALHYQQQQVLEAAKHYQERLNASQRGLDALSEEIAILRMVEKGDEDEIRAVLAVIATNGIPSLMDIVNS